MNSEKEPKPNPKFEAWLVRARADLRQLGLKTQEEQDKFISGALREDNLAAVRENLPPLGDYVRARSALDNAMDGFKHVQVLDPNEIRTDGGTQIRAGLKEEAILEYAALMSAGVQFEAVIVFYDGENYWLADGFHRVAAAKRAGRTFVNAEIKQGTRRDAVLYSVEANQEHGVQRTNDDKRRAVETLLRDEEWRQWSDGEIARRCGVSHTYVQNLRKRLFPDEEVFVRKGGDGKTYNTGKIGSRPAQRPAFNAESVSNAPGSSVDVRPLGGAAFGVGSPSSIRQGSGHNLDAEKFRVVDHIRKLISLEAFSSRDFDLRGTPWFGYRLIQGHLINANEMYKDYKVVEAFPPPPTRYWHGRWAICTNCTEREKREIAHDRWLPTESPTIWRCPYCDRRIPDQNMKVVEAPVLAQSNDPLLKVPGYERLASVCPRTVGIARILLEEGNARFAALGIEMALMVQDQAQEQIDQLVGQPFEGNL